MMKTELTKNEGSRLLKSFFDETSLLSGLEPHVVMHLNNYLYEKFNEKLIMDNEKVVVLTDYIYSHTEKQIFSILALSDTKNSYHCLLFPQINLLLAQTWRNYIRLFKTTFPEYQGIVLGEQMKRLSEYLVALKELLSIQTRANRTSGNSNSGEWENPGLEKLERFYKCERKRSYSSEQEAREGLEKGQEPYKCDYCDNYHNGRPIIMAGQIPDEVAHRRWETTWRRNHTPN